MRTAFLVACLAAAAVPSAIMGVSLRPADHIKEDFAKLEKDLARVQGDSASSQVALSTHRDFLYNDMKSRGLDLSVTGAVEKHRYFRGVSLLGKERDLILTSTKGAYANSVEWSLQHRDVTDASNPSFVYGGGMGSCYKHSQSEFKLNCRIDGRQAEVEVISANGIVVHGPTSVRDDRVFWEYKPYRGRIDVDEVVENVAGFLRTFLGEVSESLANSLDHEIMRHPRNMENLSKMYEGARSGIVRSLRQHLAVFDEHNAVRGDYTAAKRAEDKETLESLINAVEKQFESMVKWAKVVNEAYDSVEVDNTKFKLGPDTVPASSIYNDEIKSFVARVSESKNPELDEEASKLLRSGTKAGGKAMSKAMKKMLEHAEGTSQDKNRLMAALSDGTMDKYFDENLFDAISSSEVMVNSLNDATAFAERAEETLKRRAEEIGDWAKSLVGIEKKKKAVSDKVPEGSLAPGEAAVIESVAAAKSRADIAAAEKKAAKLKMEHKFRFKPKFEYKNALSGDLKSVFSRIDVGYQLKLAKGKSQATVDLNVRVEDPLDPAKAKAVMEAKIDASRKTGRGTVSTGVSARANVVGIYKAPEVEDVILSAYVRYASDDGRIKAGFFTTLAVPLTSAGNERTSYKEGAELSFGANFEWNSHDGRQKFTAYVNGKASQMGSHELRAGARYSHQLTDTMSFFVDVSAGHSFRGGQDMGPRGENDARAMIGFQWRF